MPYVPMSSGPLTFQVERLMAFLVTNTLSAGKIIQFIQFINHFAMITDWLTIKTKDWSFSIMFFAHMVKVPIFKTGLFYQENNA